MGPPCSTPQLSKTHPYPCSGRATSLTSTPPSSDFRPPSEGRTQARSLSVGSLETRSRGELGSTSSLGTIGSASGIPRPRRGSGRYASLADVGINDHVVDREHSRTPASTAPVNLAARIHDSRVVRQGFQITFWDIWYWISRSEQEILWKRFPWPRMVLGISTFLIILTLLLILSSPGWWDFESCGSQSRGGIRLVAASAAMSACILCLKPRLVSGLWDPEEGIEQGELPTTTTLRPQIAKEDVELSSKARLTTALPAELTTPNHSSLACTTEKPHPRPNCLSSTPSAEARAALPEPSLSSSRPSRSEFRFLPTRPSFLGWVSEPKGDPDRCGGYSDVWKCCIRFCEPSDGHPIEVAVKVLRKVDLHQFGDGESHQRILARFEQEGITWSGLAHANIVPLIGYTLAPSPRFISPWYRQGSLRQYLAKNTSVHRLKLLRGIAKALDYLHSRIPRIAHGDIKPENVLIDDQIEPRLADFGLATILGEEHMYTISQQQAGTRRWMAPEQILGGSRSCESDTYSFGSLAFWVMTFELPFASLSDNGIIVAVNDHTKPVSPVQDWNKYPELESSLRDIIRDCWSPEPEERPSMSVVVERLAALVELSDGGVATIPRDPLS